MNIRKQIDRFRAWQKEPYKYTDKGMKMQRCANCGHEFTGNYCPVCGQKAEGARVTWRWVWKNMMNLWGMDSRSMPYTLWQLLLRPGYLISDYLSGRRKVSFPPFNMLFIVAIIYTLANYILGIEAPTIEIDVNDSMRYLYKSIDWLQNNPGWGMMMLTMILILPTWVLFRFAPRHTCHTFPESVFIQLFMTTLMLILSFVISVTFKWMYLLIPLYYFFCYRQLFGYGVWSTIWRLILCFFVWLDLFFIVICAAIVISTLIKDGFDFSGILLGSFIVIAILLVVVAAILAFGYFISRKQIRKHEKK
ncbi:MAG: DUF3667 domain-containing protein [Bacteroidales bacterium]|nr:DUF3667 domain-containing protein [Bacteroidales bacterium]